MEHYISLGRRPPPALHYIIHCDSKHVGGQDARTIHPLLGGDGGGGDGPVFLNKSCDGDYAHLHEWEGGGLGLNVPPPRPNQTEEPRYLKLMRKGQPHKLATCSSHGNFSETPCRMNGATQRSWAADSLGTKEAVGDGGGGGARASHHLHVSQRSPIHFLALNFDSCPAVSCLTLVSAFNGSAARPNST